MNKQTIFLPQDEKNKQKMFVLSSSGLKINESPNSSSNLLTPQ